MFSEETERRMRSEVMSKKDTIKEKIVELMKDAALEEVEEVLTFALQRLRAQGVSPSHIRDLDCHYQDGTEPQGGH